LKGRNRAILGGDPALAGAPSEVLEAAGRLAAALALLLDRGEFGLDLDVEARVHPGTIAPIRTLKS
jgi:hypothetical protein